MLLLSGNCVARGLVAYWRLDEKTGTIIADTIGSNTGTWVGTNILTNGDMDDWTGDDPDGWTATGEGGGNLITEADSDGTTPPAGGAGTGNHCRIVSDGTLVEISQLILTIGKTYSISINVTAVADGDIGVSVDGGLTLLESISTTGIKTYTAVAENAKFRVKRAFGSGTVDATFTDVSVRETVDSREGTVDTALLFDSAGDNITVPADPSIDANGKSQLSISAWINPASDGSGVVARILDKNNGGATGYYLSVDPEVAGSVPIKSVIRHATTAMTVVSNAVVPLNEWSHIVLTYNETGTGNGKLYLNGDLLALDTDTAGDAAGTLSDDSAVGLVIGSNDDGDRPFDGLIDDVKIYNVALTAAEAKASFKSAFGVYRGRYSGEYRSNYRSRYK